MKCRCENCDAVVDMKTERFYVSGWHEVQRCYHCNSLRTVQTNEPYRLPKWERNAPAIPVDSLL